MPFRRSGKGVPWRRALDATIQELTAAIASGNTEAFARFYRGWFDRAYAMARRATGRDEAFCLDVVQEAMMRVIRSMRQMQTEAQVTAWLRAVVMSCAYDLLRKERRRRLREIAAVPLSKAEGESVDDRLDRLRSELMQLDARTYSLIALRYRFGWTLQRIGEMLGMKPGAVDGRIRRGLQELSEKKCDE